MTAWGNRALIVEDDPSWQAILSEILSDHGFEVEIMDSLVNSLPAILSTTHRLAVVDLALAGSDHHNQDGLHVLDAIRLHDPGCVSILLSGYTNVEVAVSVISEHGAFTCLRKETFNRRQFREIISRALASIPPLPGRQETLQEAQPGEWDPGRAGEGHACVPPLPALSHKGRRGGLVLHKTNRHCRLFARE